MRTLLLSVSNDLKILSCRPNKKDSQAKPKYTMELNKIREIIPGHGTPAFENSKGVYRGGIKLYWYSTKTRKMFHNYEWKPEEFEYRMR